MNSLKNNWRCLLGGVLMLPLLIILGIIVHKILGSSLPDFLRFMVMGVLITVSTVVGVILICSCFEQKRERKANNLGAISVAVLFVIALLAFSAPVHAEEAMITFTYDDGSQTIFTNAFPAMGSFPSHTLCKNKLYRT